jgi:hypothetical protein
LGKVLKPAEVEGSLSDAAGAEGGDGDIKLFLAPSRPDDLTTGGSKGAELDETTVADEAKFKEFLCEATLAPETAWGDIPSDTPAASAGRMGSVDIALCKDEKERGKKGPADLEF